MFLRHPQAVRTHSHAQNGHSRPSWQGPFNFVSDLINGGRKHKVEMEKVRMEGERNRLEHERQTTQIFLNGAKEIQEQWDNVQKEMQRSHLLNKAHVDGTAKERLDTLIARDTQRRAENEEREKQFHARTEEERKAVQQEFQSHLEELAEEYEKLQDNERNERLTREERFNAQLNLMDKALQLLNDALVNETQNYNSIKTELAERLAKDQKALQEKAIEEGREFGERERELMLETVQKREKHQLAILVAAQGIATGRVDETFRQLLGRFRTDSSNLRNHHIKAELQASPDSRTKKYLVEVNESDSFVEAGEELKDLQARLNAVSHLVQELQGAVDDPSFPDGQRQSFVDSFRQVIEDLRLYQKVTAKLIQEVSMDRAISRCDLKNFNDSAQSFIRSVDLVPLYQTNSALAIGL